MIIYPIVELIRLEEDFKYGTFGVLKIQKEVFCVTLEPADLLNKKGISSIPAQQYTCERYSSQKYPNTFQIMNVPDRDLILFHAGNEITHTEGCVILAQYYGKLKSVGRAVLNSGSTFNEFMERMIDFDQFHLTIKEVY